MSDIQYVLSTPMGQGFIMMAVAAVPLEEVFENVRE